VVNEEALRALAELLLEHARQASVDGEEGGADESEDHS
jgi:hypothetical protein